MVEIVDKHKRSYRSRDEIYHDILDVLAGNVEMCIGDVDPKVGCIKTHIVYTAGLGQKISKLYLNELIESGRIIQKANRYLITSEGLVHLRGT